MTKLKTLIVLINTDEGGDFNDDAKDPHIILADEINGKTFANATEIVDKIKEKNSEIETIQMWTVPDFVQSFNAEQVNDQAWIAYAFIPDNE